MAIKTAWKNHAIVIDQAFVSGKHRVTVDGRLVFEGKLIDGKPQSIADGAVTYVVEQRVVSRMMSIATATRVQVIENGETVHDVTLDDTGRPVRDMAAAKEAAGGRWLIQVCGLIGVFIALGGLRVTGGFGSGITGGAIGGGIAGGIGGFGGACVGWCLQQLFYPKKR